MAMKTVKERRFKNHAAMKTHGPLCGLVWISLVNWPYGNLRTARDLLVMENSRPYPGTVMNIEARVL